MKTQSHEYPEHQGAVMTYGSSPTDLVAFLDESRKPPRDRATGKVEQHRWIYVIACVVVFRDDLDLYRKQLLETESELGYKLHYGETMESRQRRHEAATGVANLGDWDGYIFETAEPYEERSGAERKVRAAQLKKAYTFLDGEGIEEAVLETRSRSGSDRNTLDARDISVLQKLQSKGIVSHKFRIRHDTKDEPMLKIADVLAGSRSDYRCVKDEAIYPLLSHRVISVH